MKDSIDNCSTSSDERIKEESLDLHPKSNRSIDNQSSWYRYVPIGEFNVLNPLVFSRLADVYTSEESDEKNQRLKSNISYSSVELTNLSQTMFFFVSIWVEFDWNMMLIHLVHHHEEWWRITHERMRIFSNHFPNEFHLKINIQLRKCSFCSTIWSSHWIFCGFRYFLPTAFDCKQKRQELANELLSIFNVDVFSSQVLLIRCSVLFRLWCSFLSFRIELVWCGVVV